MRIGQGPARPGRRMKLPVSVSHSDALSEERPARGSGSDTFHAPSAQVWEERACSRIGGRAPLSARPASRTVQVSRGGCDFLCRNVLPSWSSQYIDHLS